MNRKRTDTKTKVGVTNANAKKPVSTTNAAAKPKKKPSGKPFEKGNKIGNRFKPGDDPNRNIHGQRNKEAVQLTTEMRNLYVKVFNEEFEDTGMSNFEFGVRRQVREGVTGDNEAWEAALNRTWGKSTQPIEVNKEEDEDAIIVRKCLEGPPTVEARDAAIYQIIKNAIRREKEAEEKAAKAGEGH